MGEVRLAKNFLDILRLLYEQVSVFTSMDERRGVTVNSNSFSVKPFYNINNLKFSFLKELRKNAKVDVHFIDFSITNFPAVLFLAN